MIVADFVRHLLPEMLKAYCEYKKLTFTIPKNKKPHDIALAFMSYIEQLSSNDKGSIELDFQDMKEIANEKGSLLLVEEKNDIFNSVPKSLRDEMSPYDKAMWSFIHEPDVFNQASLEYTVEYTTGWSAYQLQPSTNADIESKKDKMANAIGKHLQKEEGRGELCTSEYYKKDDYICFIVYPEDFMSRDISYEKDKSLNKRNSRRPVFKIYFVYLPKLNRLYIKSKKIRSKVKKLTLAQIFVDEIFEQTLRQENSVQYDLNILKEKIRKEDYSFSSPPQDEVKGIKVTSLRIAFVGMDRMMTLDESKIGDDGLEDIAQWQKQLQIANVSYKILQAKIRVKFTPKIKRQRGDVTATITTSSCSLGLKEFERKVSQYLVDWGIDVPTQR